MTLVSSGPASALAVTATARNLASFKRRLSDRTEAKDWDAVVDVLSEITVSCFGARKAAEKLSSFSEPEHRSCKVEFYGTLGGKGAPVIRYSMHPPGLPLPPLTLSFPKTLDCSASAVNFPSPSSRRAAWAKWYKCCVRAAKMTS